jgi:hypothetical protein
MPPFLAFGFVAAGSGAFAAGSMLLSVLRRREVEVELSAANGLNVWFTDGVLGADVALPHRCDCRLPLRCIEALGNAGAAVSASGVAAPGGGPWPKRTAPRSVLGLLALRSCRPAGCRMLRLCGPAAWFDCGEVGAAMGKVGLSGLGEAVRGGALGVYDGGGSPWALSGGETSGLCGRRGAAERAELCGDGTPLALGEKLLLACELAVVRDEPETGPPLPALPARRIDGLLGVDVPERRPDDSDAPELPCGISPCSSRISACGSSELPARAATCATRARPARSSDEPSMVLLNVGVAKAPATRPSSAAAPRACTSAEEMPGPMLCARRRGSRSDERAWKSDTVWLMMTDSSPSSRRFEPMPVGAG